MTVPTGGFVPRVARTPHYDGVKRGGKEPAVIGIFGQAPIDFKLIDPTKPQVREVWEAVAACAPQCRDEASLPQCENGRIALTGTGSELLADDRVRSASLGL